jgi:hypothetical protein
MYKMFFDLQKQKQRQRKNGDKVIMVKHMKTPESHATNL